LQRIRELDDEAVVIVMTAYASLETAVRAIKCDAYDYLIKPFDDTDKVLAVIEKGMEKHRELIEGKELP
ncbi:MAG: response regulator, partial [Anaerolineae bacterium]